MSVASFVDRNLRLADVLMNFNFHVLDVSVAQPTTLSLSYGFQQCTAPEIKINTKKIKEGTYPYPHTVMESAEVPEITLSNGAKFFDSDFYDWIRGFINGDINRRRDLLIIQYSQISANSVGRALGIGNLLPGGVGLSPFLDIVGRVPARAWMCKSCIPTAYKSSEDFDAISHQPSIQQLTFQCKFFEEFNTGV